MHNPSFTLESHETEELLGRLAEWRLGICSNGTLASEACFVLDRMPSIVIIPKSTKPLTTFINTTSKWTFNLVQIGVISNNSDDALLQTLADSYMIFKSLFQNRAGSFNTAHAIRLEEYSTISIDNILRPTDGMKKSIEGVLSESNEEVRWSRLMGFWDNFGYYWPRKLILGFREHCSKPYACKDQTTNTNTYQSTHLVLKEKMNRIQPRKDPYDLHDFIKNAVIAARQDLTPLHELFDANHREQIKEMIQQRFTQIPVGHHLKIYNSANDCYLAWSPRHSEDKYGDNFAIRPLTRDNLTAKSDKQYLWQLEWTTTVIEQQINIADHTSPTVRGGSCVYIHPSCRTKLRRQNITDSSSTVEVDTHKMMLVCQPPESYNSNDHMSTIRPLRL
ncbi:hypothetical protein K501DRAFT_310729 [Backusella circina FSU 941]|nr:hypothetical protein K501DRAFT_310729 [Backusella circina FSU 941]